MSDVLVKFDEPINDPSGARFFVRALGRKREDGLWEGWLEFLATEEDVPAIDSGRETTQPNRADLEYWAQGLTLVYLQGALVRAQSPTEAIQRDRFAREAPRDI
jgi:hypothetical protein